MQFIRVAKTSEFDDTRLKSYQILGRKVGVFKDEDGGFFAMEVACKHQNWDMTTGLVENSTLTCPRHGWRYDIRTGACLNRDSAPLRRYACKVEDGSILISPYPLDDDGGSG